MKGMRPLMKHAIALILLLICCGCSTPASVSQMQGKGTQRLFDGTYNQVWKAAIFACAAHELDVVSSDKMAGTIVASRGTRMESWGENVAMWINKDGDKHCHVEVVSRMAGPSALFYFDWEEPVLHSMEVWLDAEKPKATEGE